jgi:outer membrane protein OmpA-like peptidoglycan-associated protein
VFQALVIIPNFKIKKPEKKEKLVEEPKATAPQKITFIASVVDSTTNKPISAVLTIANKHDVKSEVATTSGFINTSLFNNDVYTITVESFGYQPKTFTIKLDNYPLDRITRNYALSMIKVGASVTLNNIYFEKASAMLLPESKPELEKIFQFMNSNPKIAIELSGHTSSEGKDDYNMQLSSERANAIKSWLTEKGIDENRINAIGYGKTKPVADNSTEEGRKKNRRVELKVIKN